MANQIPVGKYFVTYEGLPSDWYLKLTGAATQMIRGEVPALGDDSGEAAVTEGLKRGYFRSHVERRVVLVACPPVLRSRDCTYRRGHVTRAVCLGFSTAQERFVHPLNLPPSYLLASLGAARLSGLMARASLCGRAGNGAWGSVWYQQATEAMSSSSGR